MGYFSSLLWRWQTSSERHWTRASSCDTSHCDSSFWRLATSGKGRRNQCGIFLSDPNPKTFSGMPEDNKIKFINLHEKKKNNNLHFWYLQSLFVFETEIVKSKIVETIRLGWGNDGPLNRPQKNKKTKTEKQKLKQAKYWKLFDRYKKEDNTPGEKDSSPFS